MFQGLFAALSAQKQASIADVRLNLSRAHARAQPHGCYIQSEQV